MEGFLARLSQGPPLIMGVLNVTPDSFSDGGDFPTPHSAIQRALEMVEQGADIIDIGGESTRPPGKTYGQGALSVSPGEELDRISPVIAGFHSANSNIPISIDTVKSEVAREAIKLGASIVNDVSAGTCDDKMFVAAREFDIPIILMHGFGPAFQKSSVDDYSYRDVVQEIILYLKERMGTAKEAGVRQILIDPGFGFAKGFRDNMQILKNLTSFSELGVPIVLGVSRKSSIGKAMTDAFMETPMPKERLAGSITAQVYGAMNGARIIRTHDVKATRESLSVLDAITSA